MGVAVVTGIGFANTLKILHRQANGSHPKQSSWTS